MAGSLPSRRLKTTGVNKNGASKGHDSFLIKKKGGGGGFLGFGHLSFKRNNTKTAVTNIRNNKRIV